MKVGAGKGVIGVDLKKSWPGGGGVSGQPENPPGYATEVRRPYTHRHANLGII